MKVKKLLQFYRVNKTTLENELISTYVYDADKLIKQFEIPADCSYFEVYCQVEAKKGKYHFVSKKINRATYDFSSAYKKRQSKEECVSNALRKCAAPVITSEIEDVKPQNLIRYTNVPHSDYLVEPVRVQHPKSYDLSNVVLRMGECCFELCAKFVGEVETQSGSLVLTSVEDIKHNTFYVGQPLEFDLQLDLVRAKTENGQGFVCPRSEFINLEYIDKYGRILNLSNDRKL